MTCQEAERLVFPYIRDELDGDTVEAFLEHIDSCKALRSWIRGPAPTILRGIWSGSWRIPTTR